MSKKQFRLWPLPQEGSGLPYGPTPKQKLLFIEDLPDPQPGMTAEQLAYCRPHYHPLDVVLFIGAARCLTPETEVMMYDGSTRRVDELKVGDVLLGPDSLPRHVVDVNKGQDYIYEIRSDKGMTWRCSRDHELNLRSKDGKHYRIPLKQYLCLDSSEKDKLHLWRPASIYKDGKWDETKQPLMYRFKVKERPDLDDYISISVEGIDTCIMLKDRTVIENSGKSQASAARIVNYLHRYKNTFAILGAISFKVLSQNTLADLRKLFSSDDNPDDWAHLDEPDSIILPKGKITNLQYKDELPFRNGSRAKFKYFSNAAQLKGLNASFVNFEECDMLPDASAFEELNSRMANGKSDLRQIVMNTNPKRARIGWVADKFKLHQLDTRHKGEKEPIVAPCTCHYCPKCYKKFGEKHEFVDEEGNTSNKKGSICSNKNCAFRLVTAYGNTPEGIRLRKDNNCPGNQVFYRVIEISSNDNPHKPSDYEQSASAGMTAKSARAMIDGAIEQDYEGEVYNAFSGENINFTEKELDPTKDLIWAMDQDEDPHASVICQETETEEFIRVDAIDEIYEWDHGPVEASKIFCERYHKFKHKFTGTEVRLYCDPAGITQGSNSKRKVTFYRTVYDYLKLPTDEFGNPVTKQDGERKVPDYDNPAGAFFVPKMMQKKDNRSYKDPKKELILINIDQKVQCSNLMFCNELGERRVFINRRCKNLTRSLQNVKWDGPGKIDKTIDKKAKLHRDQDLPATHMSDALGYYLATRFKRVKDKRGIICAAGKGNEVMVYQNGKFTSKLQEELDAELAELNKKKKESYLPPKAKTPQRPIKSTKDFLRHYGLNKTRRGTI